MIYTVASFFPSIIWTILSGMFLTVGDILMRVWFSKPWPYGFIMIFGIYMVGVLSMILSFFGQGIPVATTLAIILNIVGYTLFAYVYFDDVLSTTQLVGITLGLMTIIILEMA